MSALVSNLEELTAALDHGSDGTRLAAAFDVADLAAARSALRAVVASWEQPDAANATSSNDRTRR